MTSSPKTADPTGAPGVPFIPDLFELGAAGSTVLLAGRCEACGAYSFPRRLVCSHCGPGPDVKQVHVSGTGKVYASTVVRVPSPVGLKSPYAYGYVDLDDIPLRVFGLFSRGDAEGIAPRTRVRLITDSLYVDSAGRNLLAYKFERVPEAGGTL